MDAFANFADRVDALEYFANDGDFRVQEFQAHGRESRSRSASPVDTSRPKKRGPRRKRPCDGCNALFHKYSDRCNHKEGVGCDRCFWWGLICVVDGEIKPPRQDKERPKQYYFGRCKNCMDNSALCDRKRPCDRCHGLGLQCDTGDNLKGCFRRGVPGDDGPLYYHRMNRGPTGLNDNNYDPNWCPTQDYGRDWLYGGEAVRADIVLAATLVKKPWVNNNRTRAGNSGARNSPDPFDSDAPLQINSPAGGAAAGPSPSAFLGTGLTPGGFSDDGLGLGLGLTPPGGPSGADNNEGLALAYRETLLDDGEVPSNEEEGALLTSYNEVWQLVKGLWFDQRITDIQQFRQSLRADLMARRPLDASPASQSVWQALTAITDSQKEVLAAEMNVVLPADADLTYVAYLNPGLQPILNVAPLPLGRHVSPGPPRPFFAADGGNAPAAAAMIGSSTVSFPPGHPHYHPMSLANRPASLHPNPEALQVLGSIPSSRVLPRGVADPTRGRLACSAWVARDAFSSGLGDGARCGAPTGTVCEDRRHAGDGAPLCASCEEACRARFRQDFATWFAELRFWACHACGEALTRQSGHEGGGHGIFADPSVVQEENGVLDSTTILPSSSASGGPVLRGGPASALRPVTGCGCYAKLLLERLVCAPHRLLYALTMRRQAAETRRHAGAAHGAADACWRCRSRPGVDHYGFRGHWGAEGRARAFVCVACQGVVVGGPDVVNAGMVPGGEEALGFGGHGPAAGAAAGVGGAGAGAGAGGGDEFAAPAGFVFDLGDFDFGDAGQGAGAGANQFDNLDLGAQAGDGTGANLFDNFDPAMFDPAGQEGDGEGAGVVMENDGMDVVMEDSNPPGGDQMEGWMQDILDGM
ncbi:hypothetical protein GGR56DRAFT_689296 [Xylariaceae sp. FL0804]|nr:hypothetical protein GGR56DRAFT_689296 [Xylariaceae sp. FL0804]